MSNKNLVIINNEKIFIENNSFYCNNFNVKALPEELNNYYKVEYIVRNSKKKGGQEIKLKNIKTTSNFLKLFYFIIKTFKNKDTKYLLISITPYTFIAFLILFLFRKKIFIYLISSGHEEYRHILGSLFVWIYHFMYVITTSFSEVIVCHKRLFNKKRSHVVYISRLDDQWQMNHKNVQLNKIKYLYVGRMSAEKGIFEFLKMFNKLKMDAEISIVGDSEKHNFLNKNIKLLGYISNPQLLINIYDQHNIMVLPSFTEATPYVVDESLSRKRPVIIFEDIDYIVRDKIGIFVCKRNIDSFSKTTNYIMSNYLKIQKNMEKNILPTQKSMIKQISDIINLQNS